MPVLIAVVLGLVEGLTEYLPVSSTGHLVLVGHLLGLNDDDPATSAFEIVVQLGAILAVLVHYRTLLGRRAMGLLKREPASIALLSALVLAFLPAALAGLVLRKAIKAHLFGPLPVAAALVAGGIAMIAIERIIVRPREKGVLGGAQGVRAAGDARDTGHGGGALRASEASGGGDELQQVTPGKALLIGLGQCLSMWPGMSRSMCTIVTGQLVGLSTATAAEFSFLLALPTLGAATVYEGYKSRAALQAHVGGASMMVGLLVSFVVAWGVIASFLRYLKTRGLEPFGWYRIVLGVLVLWVLAR